MAIAVGALFALIGVIFASLLFLLIGRKWQFSLRALFIAMTLIAVTLGLIVALSHGSISDARLEIQPHSAATDPDNNTSEFSAVAS